jgi:hypothetical protein
MRRADGFHTSFMVYWSIGSIERGIDCVKQLLDVFTGTATLQCAAAVMLIALFVMISTPID